MLSLTCEIQHFSQAGSGGTQRKLCLRVIGHVPASNYWQRQDLSVLLVVIITPIFYAVFKDHFNCPGVSIYGIIVINDGEKGVGG